MLLNIRNHLSWFIRFNKIVNWALFSRYVLSQKGRAIEVLDDVVTGECITYNDLAAALRSVLLLLNSQNH